MAERRIYTELLGRNPSDSDVASSLMVNRVALAKIMMQQRRLADAVGELRTAARDGQALVASDPHNTEFPDELSGVFTLLGQAELEEGAASAAEADARRGEGLAEALVRKDP